MGNHHTTTVHHSNPNIFNEIQPSSPSNGDQHHHATHSKYFSKRKSQRSMTSSFVSSSENVHVLSNPSTFMNSNPQSDEDSHDINALTKDMEFTADLLRLVKEQSQMDEHEKKSGLPFGVILVGSCDSGKSTLWNQWKFQSSSLSQSERIEFGNALMTYLVTSMKRLILLAIRTKKQFESSLDSSQVSNSSSSESHIHEQQEEPSLVDSETSTTTTTSTCSSCCCCSCSLWKHLFSRYSVVMDLLFNQRSPSTTTTSLKESISGFSCGNSINTCNNNNNSKRNLKCITEEYSKEEQWIPFETLFLNPLSKHLLQSMWMNHDLLRQLCAIFREPEISQIYYGVSSFNRENGHSLCGQKEFLKPVDTCSCNCGCDCGSVETVGMVHEMLYGNYLHYFLQEERVLLRLANEVLNNPLNNILQEEVVLKAKVLTTSIQSLKFQYSQRSICTRVIRVIEKRKKELRKLEGATIHDCTTNLLQTQPLKNTTKSHHQQDINTSGGVGGVCGGSGNTCSSVVVSSSSSTTTNNSSLKIRIPKLDLNRAQLQTMNTVGMQSSSPLLPKSARGGNTSSRNNSLNSSRVNSPSSQTPTLHERLSQEESEWHLNGTSPRSPMSSRKPSSAAQKLMEMVRKRSNSNNNNNNMAMSTSPKSPSRFMNAQNNTCSSPQSQFTNSRNATSSIAKVMQESSNAPLDAMEKRKLQKFTMIDTPGLSSQRDLVVMTINASTKPTSTFLLKSVVFVFSLADFDLPCLDSSEFETRLEESLNLFEKTMTLSSLKERRKILLMTHVDIFVHRMSHLGNDERDRLLKILNSDRSREDTDHLIGACFKWILSQFKNIEEGRNFNHKYTLEVYAINLMNEKQVKEFTFALTVKDDGILKQTQQQVITVFTCPSLKGVECEENRKLLCNHSFVDVEFKFRDDETMSRP
ncbi:hypothetical protein FDP41_007793 [Naegleria fowleri]|uniref:Uncharacterized protein n=1 Tax=Naegleria fowleri TaxID=5763 RepID=A0A6A5CEF7_NAEFO|nr:uncharacterized protein FDP41_007793 [Naegleria fowleri]KAF0983878.1 hypothetical protein FDP41_007793 [Naegleria fowleri]